MEDGLCSSHGSRGKAFNYTRVISVFTHIKKTLAHTLFIDKFDVLIRLVRQYVILISLLTPNITV